MKAKDWFSRFDLLRLSRQSVTLLLAEMCLGPFAAHAKDFDWHSDSGGGLVR